MSIAQKRGEKICKEVQAKMPGNDQWSTYASITQAASACTVSTASITRCCNGLQYDTAEGYRFRYKDEAMRPVVEASPPERNCKRIQCTKAEEKYIFNKIQDAATLLQRAPSTISHAIKKQRLINGFCVEELAQL